MQISHSFLGDVYFSENYVTKKFSKILFSFQVRLAIGVAF